MEVVVMRRRRKRKRRPKQRTASGIYSTAVWADNANSIYLVTHTRATTHNHTHTSYLSAHAHTHPRAYVLVRLLFICLYGMNDSSRIGIPARRSCDLSCAIRTGADQ